MVSIGLYHKQLIFFLGLTIVTFGIGWLIQNQTSFASGRPIRLPNSEEPIAVEVTLADHGVAKIDGSTVGNVVQFGSRKDELRYLIIDQPLVSVETLLIRFKFPRAVNQDLVRQSGVLIYDLAATWEANWQDSTTLVYTLKNIGPAMKFTVVAELPKGVIEPSPAQRIFGTIRSWPQIVWLTLAVILPLITLIILLLVLWPGLKQKWFGEINRRRPTPPESAPPAIITALVEGRISSRAIAATLLDLARREYLEIASHDGTYTFMKRRQYFSENGQQALQPFEKLLLQKIFEDTTQASLTEMQVRIGQTDFSDKVAAVYLAIYEAVTRRGYFYDNPSKIHGSFRLAGLALFFLGLAGFGFGATFFNDPPTPLLFWVGMMISALIVIAFAPELPVLTPTGQTVRQEWLAFKNELECRAPVSFEAMTQQVFLTYLPYAIALGVEVEWTERFREAVFNLPEWYHSGKQILNLHDFVNDVFPMIGFLARQLAAARSPTLS